MECYSLKADQRLESPLDVLSRAASMIQKENSQISDVPQRNDGRKLRSYLSPEVISLIYGLSYYKGTTVYLLRHETNIMNPVYSSNEIDLGRNNDAHF